MVLDMMHTIFLVHCQMLFQGIYWNTEVMMCQFNGVVAFTILVDTS